MKKIYLTVLTAFFLLHDFRLFAQGGPGDDNDNGDLEGNDPPATPINSKLFFLALAGIAFVFYLYNTRKQKSLR